MTCPALELEPAAVADVESIACPDAHWWTRWANGSVLMPTGHAGAFASRELLLEGTANDHHGPKATCKWHVTFYPLSPNSLPPPLSLRITIAWPIACKQVMHACPWLRLTSAYVLWPLHQ